MTRFVEILKDLFSPSAFKVGVAITGLFMILAFQFYSDTGEESWLMERLNQLHQSSIDIRLRDRGPQPVGDNIAIVAVDEVSEEKLGRWPWPRGRIAEIIDILVSYGAKVVAFDAVFVEPDRNQATISLTKLKESNLATPELEEIINQELSRANTDWILARTVEKQSRHLVMGSYYDERNDRFYPYQEYCGNLLIENTPWYGRLQKEEAPVIVTDSLPEQVPEVFKSLLDQSFRDIEQKTIAQWTRENKEVHKLKNAVAEAKAAYCDRWLIQNGELKDEYFQMSSKAWEESKAGIEDWEHLTYEEAAARIRSNYLHNKVHRTGRWWLNLPVITEGAKHNAYFNAFLDGDGTIRRSGLVVRYGNVYMPSLALKAALVANEWNVMVSIDRDPTDPNSKMLTKMTIIDSEGNEVKKIPVDGRGQLLINFAGSDRSYPHISVKELFNKSDTIEISYRAGDSILKKSVNKIEFLKDKILVFGATSTGTYDLRITPFSENYPGVETHANLIDNLIRNNFLVSYHDEGPKMILALAIVGLLLSLGLSHLGAVQGLLLTFGFLLCVYILDRFYFFANGIIIAVALPIALISIKYVCLTFYKYLTEERKKKAIKGTFEKYVSPAIVAEVLRHPDNVGLGGKKQRMTVLFSDLRGFTTISEKLDPQVLVEVLNKYLTPMTDIVFKNQGTLDKYMGDAIMAFFGAPISYKDHAKMACQCALEMIELLPKINEEFRKQGLPQIDVGIGINTGEMSVGNMGSETVRSYTVMGDAVNLGSRLEGINKQYGTRIIVSEYTYNDIKDDFFAREVDWVRVKGKQQPVRIFELLAKKTEQFKHTELLSEFEKGFAAYHQRQFELAIDHFTKALNLNPSDSPSKLYVDRSQEYLSNPPPSEWDGVYEMKTK